MKANRGFDWLLLIAFALLALLAFGYPLFVMMPFRAQGAWELLFSLELRKWAPGIATVSAVGALILAGLLWRGLSKRRKLVAALAAGSAVAFSVLSYVNIYEMVFHGVRSPVFVAPADAKVEPDDMVLAVNVGGEARAYPIRMLGYHHMVNDRMAGVALVATY